MLNETVTELSLGGIGIFICFQRLLKLRKIKIFQFPLTFFIVWIQL